MDYRELKEKISNLKVDNKIIITKDVISFDAKIYEVKVKEKSTLKRRYQLMKLIL